MAREELRGAVRVSRPLEIEYSCNCPPISATVQDISEDGMFIDSQHPMNQGDVITFKLTLPGHGDPIQGKAEVMWTQQMVGIGVHFTKVGDDDRERIKFFVASEFFS